MKIAIEITPLLAAREQFGDKSGVYQITYNFIKHLIQIDHTDKITLFDYLSLFNNTVNIEVYNLLGKNVEVISFNFPRADYKYKFRKMLPTPVRRLSRPLTKKVEDFFRERNLRRVLDQYDIVHSSESVYLTGNRTKNVITINDLVTVLFPRSQPEETVELHQRKLSFARNKADKIITISKNTKNDLVKHVRIPPEKVEVVYPDAGEEFKPIKDLKKIREVVTKYDLSPFNYFLYTGTIEPRKNLIALVRAFCKLDFEDGINKKLVIAGGAGWGKTKEHLETMIKEYKLQDKILMPGFVPQDYLPHLYNGAFAFIFPSFYEGFGLPVLEAMRCGIPVICSDRSSLPEVAGKAAIFINPQDLNSIIKAIKEMNENEVLRGKLVEAGFKQATKFSWKKNAQQVLSIYRSLVKD